MNKINNINIPETDFNRLRRYELKYIISENQAAEIRQWISPIFSLDRHADPDSLGYTVNNVYFDTNDLKFYFDTKFKQTSRFKLRARYYGSQPNGTVWLEVKNKCNSIVWKKRSRANSDDWESIIGRQTIPANGRPVVIRKPALFEELIGQFQVEPIVRVRYFREPWVSEIDDYGRVTFDRYLRYRYCPGVDSLDCPDREMTFYDDAITTKGDCFRDRSFVLLEIKTETQVPFWAIDLVRRFGLCQRGFSKYCYAIDAAGEVPLPRRSCFLEKKGAHSAMNGSGTKPDAKGDSRC